jgi:hypothetical protein
MFREMATALIRISIAAQLLRKRQYFSVSCINIKLSAQHIITTLGMCTNMDDDYPTGHTNREDYTDDIYSVNRRNAMKMVGTLSLGAPLLTTTATAATEDLRQISYGETKTGRVDGYDPETNVNGFFYEPVSFTGSEGDEVTATLSSDRFDVSVNTLITPSGEERPFGGLANPVTGPPYEKSDTITLEESGEYTLRIGNSELSKYGEYQLTLENETRTPLEEAIEISIENNFVDAQPDGFLEALYDVSQSAVLPPGAGDDPNKNEAYINTDIDVTIPNADDREIESVSLKLESDIENREDWSINTRDYESGVMTPVDENTFRYEPLTIKTPTQVGLMAFKGIMMAVGLAGKPTGEVGSAVNAKTSAYPDVSIVGIQVTYDDGTSTTVDINRELPRYSDICPTSIGDTVLSNYPDPQCDKEEYINTLPADADYVAIASPASVSITAPDGRRVGRVYEDGEFKTVNEIPDAIYSGPLHHEFAIIPRDDNNEINITGTGSGDATIFVERAASDTAERRIYRNVSVNEDSKITGRVSNSTLSVVQGTDQTAISPTDSTTLSSPSDAITTPISPDDPSPVTLSSDVPSSGQPGEEAQVTYTIEGIREQNSVTLKITEIPAELTIEQDLSDFAGGVYSDDENAILYFLPAESLTPTIAFSIAESASPNQTFTIRARVEGQDGATLAETTTEVGDVRQTLPERYDRDSNNELGLEEVRMAINDFAAGDINLKQVRTLINYWANDTPV